MAGTTNFRSQGVRYRRNRNEEWRVVWRVPSLRPSGEMHGERTYAVKSLHGVARNVRGSRFHRSVACAELGSRAGAYGRVAGQGRIFSWWRWAGERRVRRSGGMERSGGAERVERSGPWAMPEPRAHRFRTCWCWWCTRASSPECESAKETTHLGRPVPRSA